MDVALTAGGVEMFNNKYKKIGIKIQNFRKFRGYTQEKLSLLSGVSRSRISDIECGKGSFNLESLLLIARALNVDLCEIVK